MPGVPELITLGEILIDLFPAEIGRKIAQVSAFLPKPGGAPANVAIAATRLGINTAFIGKVGEDAFGDHLIQVLRQGGVETRGMRVDPQVRTTLAFIAMPDPNSAEFVFYRNPGADLMLRPDEIDESLFASCRAFHFGSLSLVEEPAYSATQHAISLARRAGALVSFDLNYRPTLWRKTDIVLERIHKLLNQIDLIKVNDSELRLLSGTSELKKGSQALLAMSPSLVAVTLGERGSFFASTYGNGLVPPFQVKTVDAIGCGDAFAAGLLSRLVHEANWQVALQPQQLEQHFTYANAVGALTALKRGVIPALPSAAKVASFLKANQNPVQ